MELVWNEINAPRLIFGGEEQTELEGALPPPDGKEVRELIDYGAEVFADACRVDAGKLTVNGRIVVKLVASDENGAVFGFTSESAFEHTAENEAFEKGMLAEALITIQDLNVRLTTDERIMLAAVIDIDYRVVSGAPVRVLSGVSGVRDMEIKSREYPIGRKIEIGSTTLSVGEEVSSDGAEAVISHSARVSVRETVFENGGITVVGAVTVSLLLRGEGGELSQLVRTMPFRENIQTSGAADEVYASAEVLSSSARALGTEFSLVAFDAEIALTVYAAQKSSVRLPLDAFSPTINFNCIKQRAVFIGTLGGVNILSTRRETASVPDGMEDIFSPSAVFVRTVLTGASVANGEAELTGVLITRVIYRTGGGRTTAFTEDVPFILHTAAPETASSVKARAEAAASITGGSSRSVLITYNIDAFAEFYSETSLDVVAGLAENTADTGEAERVGGLIIHTASDGDEVFDIAKRFRVPSSSVREMNAGCPDVFKEGDKVVLIV